MEKYIHGENPARFKKRLGQACNEFGRKVLALLAEEEAKEASLPGAKS
jgi:hypothetical protein